MGQTNAKDGRQRHSEGSSHRVNATTSSNSVSRGPAVRPTAVNDAVLQPTSVATVRHVDPKPSSSSAINTSTIKYPAVLRYADQDVKMLIEKKKQVFVMVEQQQWKPVPMTASTDSFYALVELPPGNHNFRFKVDNSDVVDSTQNLAPTGREQRPHVQQSVEMSTPVPAPLPTKDGRPANTFFLNDVLLTTREDDDTMDDGKGWGQEETMFEESRKYPPIVPLHLRYTPLNTPPTLVRCGPDGRLSVMESTGDFTRHMAAEHLPLPLSVTINHVYFQRRENHAVMGVTTRYCNKFTTVVYYTHLPAPTEVVA
ncbi:5'-AMP-activated protein kinase, regulatory beta subunit [Strigomonas culicis]|uniref:5'-AMP-activated protein kinase, regulatory beta subunit n=1 Tax=Strigomonas culicis TaxID=28005 RepID=S9UM24_9TRYP|nr:5'-AMP-activated protein kinase, regulatory beta subunit [Strigomonas culicis]EPY31264.1 5'-AMP-activated protein kinase, regulatory beta subunit [Strigomonas culicis]EPY31892.1 5'-AMP-activated protein kinase, regulatory beta subunit [Strigomonas culicis]EPY33187.1 5'-AMP-activated protein kinase, regulatory beta subunit [Strigomonas culicis]|eukprot:EPY28368.1 5'-AMP-activated protein kinase, regulatory beta subunit [Strigomonas culicis]